MISVCIPTYNGEKYIYDQLISILSQISDCDEIIISDDSSTDNTLSIIRGIDDPRIHIYSDNHFHSPVYNIENAIRHANGEYIFLSDQDDIWIDNKVSIMMSYLKEYDCVVSDAIVVDSNLTTIYPSFFKLRNSGVGILKNIIKNSYVGCCMAFRSSLLTKIIPFPRNIPMHDIWIGLNAEKYGKSIFIDDRLIMYRRHSNNASVTAEKSNNSLFRKMKMRLYIVRALIFRK